MSLAPNLPLSLSGLLSVALVAGALSPQESSTDVAYSVSVPDAHILGDAFEVQLDIQAPEGTAAEIPAWALSEAAFSIKGKALGKRERGKGLPLSAGQHITTTLDIGPAMASIDLAEASDLVLRLDLGEGQEIRVPILRAAPKGLNFMTMPLDELSQYQVVLLTLHGPIRAEFWVDVAPNHVRNFLDLAYTGFYDDNQFHRVVPGFMIQGGSAKPSRPAPRNVKNEFNSRRHVPGVLSMARMSGDTRDKDGKLIPAFDSASSEFFIMHAVYPSLDGKYTGFGKVLSGMPAVEAVVDSVKAGFNPRNPATHRPKVRQFIRRAIVIKAS